MVWAFQHEVVGGIRCVAFQAVLCRGGYVMQDGRVEVGVGFKLAP